MNKNIMVSIVALQLLFASAITARYTDVPVVIEADTIEYDVMQPDQWSDEMQWTDDMVVDAESEPVAKQLNGYVDRADVATRPKAAKSKTRKSETRKKSRASKDERDYEEKMGPWPLDLPARVLPVPYCNKCVKDDNGKVRRRVRYWPFDLPLRVLPTNYCGPCEDE